MPRYAIVNGSAGMARGAGGTNIVATRRMGVVFATLTPEQANYLRSAGCKVSLVGKVTAPVMPPTPVPAGEVSYDPEVLLWAAGINEFRALTTPPIYGQGVNVAIVDTGIRESHELINGRVIYSKNYGSAPNCDDVYDHGTGVAALILVAAPLCGIVNMKVMNDEGESTEEEVTMALDDIAVMWEDGDEAAPMIVNLSLGTPDTGNPDSAMRVACRELTNRGLWIGAAAGNDGPEPGTMASPACEQYVGAIGSVSYEPFIVSEFSSRGPTVEGLTKPDLVFFGENLLTASGQNDTATENRSGTSFSTPFGSGIAVLYFSGLARGAIPTQVIPGVGQIGEEELTTIQDAIDNYLPGLCIKPEGVMPERDNDYGCGLPFGPLATQAFKAIEAYSALSGLMTAIPAIMMLGMMGAMFSSMFKPPSPGYYTDSTADVDSSMRYCGEYGCVDLGAVFGAAIARANDARREA